MSTDRFLQRFDGSKNGQRPSAIQVKNASRATGARRRGGDRKSFCHNILSKGLKPIRVGDRREGQTDRAPYVRTVDNPLILFSTRSDHDEEDGFLGSRHRC